MGQPRLGTRYSARGKRERALRSKERELRKMKVGPRCGGGSPDLRVVEAALRPTTLSVLGGRHGAHMERGDGDWHKGSRRSDRQRATRRGGTWRPATADLDCGARAGACGRRGLEADQGEGERHPGSGKLGRPRSREGSPRPCGGPRPGRLLPARRSVTGLPPSGLTSVS